MPFSGSILSSIGLAFLHSIWQMALLFVLFRLAGWLVFTSAAQRFRLAVCFAWIGVAGFMWNLFSGGAGNASEPIAPLSISPTWLQMMLSATGFSYILVISWAGIMAFRQWKELGKIGQLPLQKAPVEWRLFVEKNAALLGITRQVQLRMTSVFAPATFGFFKPIILLPVSCITHLSTRQLEAILMHELAHIRRFDFVANLSLKIAEILLYCNPFMRLLISEARKEAEHACDDLVLQFGYPPTDYSRALMQIARNGLQPAWTLGASGCKSHPLFNRIARMVQGKENLKPTPRLIIASSLTALAVYVLAALVQDLFIEKKTNNIIDQMNVSAPSRIQDEAEPSFAEVIRQTRFSIFSSAVGKKQNIRPFTPARHQNIFSQEPSKQDLAAEMDWKTSENKPLFLTAGWVEQKPQAEKEQEQLEKGWSELKKMLEKLEEDRDLTEKEWEKLAILIAYYGNIRHSIMEDVYRMQNPVTEAFSLQPTDTQKDEVLVLIFDETTGLLAASVVNRDQLSEDLLNEKDSEDGQQVILLRKKQQGASKVIRL